MLYSTRKETISTEEFHEKILEIFPKSEHIIVEKFKKEIDNLYNQIAHFYIGRIDDYKVVLKEIFHQINFNDYKPLTNKELLLILMNKIQYWYNQND